MSLVLPVENNVRRQSFSGGKKASSSKEKFKDFQFSNLKFSKDAFCVIVKILPEKSRVLALDWLESLFDNWTRLD